ncbi:hypothetical protein [Shewanella nanhaiensis]|uniref:Uncharacterized protein n=1 Tax=Shewanella nanhaiensis TaxID=2864872 RepID=A0ABS7E957_9GAMM|nr:hypothetical protein [Shewanella nanhaiensis]MBW8186195.1 hypothetical protein [Shewanella nanhaiensis]
MEEAVDYLSSSLEEQVSLATLYRFVLDKHLTLSVRLLNQAYALGGQFITPPYSDINCYPVEYDLATNEPLDEPYIIPLDSALQVEENKWLAFDEKVHVIDGIWDLTMIGMESLDVEHQYQKELGGSEPLVAPVKGVFLKQEELVCKLQKSLPPEPTDENRAALQKELERFLHPKGLTLDDYLNCDDISECLSNAEIDSLEQLSEIMQDGLPDCEKFEDSITLEEHSYQFVIRTNELTRFVQSLDEENLEPVQTEKPLGTRERNSYLTLISVLFEEQGLNPFLKGLTSPIKLMADKAGMSISEKTILKIINEVREIKS